MNKRLLVLLLLLTACVAKDYSFTQIALDIQILENSQLLITEQFIVNFMGEFQEGYRYFEMGNIDDVADFKVVSDKGEHSFESFWEDGNKHFVWDIDEQDREVTYTLTYRITGAFKEEEDYDTLYTTAVVKDREKPVESVVVNYTFPKDISLDQLEIRNTHGSYKQLDSRTIQFDASSIAAYTPFDIEIKMPKGIVQIPFNWIKFIRMLIDIGLVVGTILATIYCLWTYFSDYWSHGRDPFIQPVKNKRLSNLKPAIAGTLVDENADIKEIIATLIDLAIRGYVMIKEEKKKGLAKLFGGKEILLVRLKSNYTNLEEYERHILNKLFGGKDQIKVSSLSQKFYTHIPKIVTKIQDSAFELGVFDAHVEKTIKKYNEKFVKIPIVMLITGFILIFFQFITALLPMFAGIFLLFVSMLFANAMPTRTGQGVEQSNKYKDLKNWMERYPLKKQRLFDEYLPYAIAFGIGDKWIRKMEALGEIKRDWYSGRLTHRSYNIFYTAMAVGMTSTPSSSGGGGSFGSGGGAGGGGVGFR